MSNYIFEHPKEALQDELKCLRKAFQRRGTDTITRWLLIAKTYITYIYRKRRYETHKRKLARQSTIGMPK